MKQTYIIIDRARHCGKVYDAEYCSLLYTLHMNASGLTDEEYETILRRDARPFCKAHGYAV